MIGPCNCPITDVSLQLTVRLQLSRLIRMKINYDFNVHLLFLSFIKSVHSRRINQ